MQPRRTSVLVSAVLVGRGLILGFIAGSGIDRGQAQEEKTRKEAGAKSGKADAPARGAYDTRKAGDTYLKQSPAAVAADRKETDYGLGENHASKLPPYPPGGPGVRTPLDLWRYAGRGENSWGSPNLPMPWDRWVEMCREQKPKLMADVHAFMAGRFDFSGKPIANATMTGGKPIMAGPVARPEGPIKTFPLRGIKDSPPYLHDGRCATLADAVEFFNIVLELKLTKQEKDDLVAFLLCL